MSSKLSLPQVSQVVLRDLLQFIIALVVTLGVFYLLIVQQKVPSELWAAWGLILGYLYGSASRENGKTQMAEIVKLLTPRQ